MAKTVSEILASSDIPRIDGKIDVKELQKQTTILVSAANKRLKNLSTSGTVSEAYEMTMRSGGKFSTKGKSASELAAEYTRVRKFLKEKTSTVQGAKFVQKQLEKKMKEAGLTTAVLRDSRYWDAFAKYRDLINKKVAPSDFDASYKDVITQNPNATPEEIADRIYRRMTKISEAEEKALEEAAREAGDFSYDYFEGWENP